MLTNLRLSSVALMICAACNSSAFADENTVSGTFKGNGKEAKLAYITAKKGEPFADKPTIILVMTEKDHSKDAKPDFNAGFGKFGSALILTIHPDGKIIGCQVVHAAHQRSGFSSVGNINMTDFKIADGKITGKVATDGEVKTFGETWEVKLELKAKAP
jgi:hypothetical protein